MDRSTPARPANQRTHVRIEERCAILGNASASTTRVEARRQPHEGQEAQLERESHIPTRARLIEPLEKSDDRLEQAWVHLVWRNERPHELEAAPRFFHPLKRRQESRKSADESRRDQATELGASKGDLGANHTKRLERSTFEARPAASGSPSKNRDPTFAIGEQRQNTIAVSVGHLTKQDRAYRHRVGSPGEHTNRVPVSR